ncbi:MAG: PHP domain-containing protein [Candidatus Omnitrophica bacterium]|nr:PHP domain-containing protein [Candidatus Omnitrophota bacterium]MDD5352816.1 PHP domain-containing protein [Candidatus Omnitrophota bacterium]MDD5550415.1 PHP domain-containing protein [Candidatus Omnitrophota bacterium]
MKLADLHLHTNFSDGTFSPAELVEEAKKAGLFCISVTDHDSVAAIDEVKKEAADSLEVIEGIELSAEIISNEVHILGYFINPNYPRLQTELKKIYEIRRQRVYDMCEKLKKLNIDLEPQEVFDISGKATASRLHIAMAMLAKGKITNIYEAFSRYIGNKKPAYVGKFSLNPMDAIKLIKEAGGIPVLAHPYATKCDELIPSFVKAGLRGLEAYYPEHSEIVTNHYLRIADKYGLLVTGGSDCHGTAKPDVGVGKVSIPYELVEKLKEEKRGR